MNRKNIYKTSMITAVAIGAALTLIFWIPNQKVSDSKTKQSATWIPKGGHTIEELNANVEAYYGDPDDVSDVARARKMQAFIMEIAIKAKTRNPHFQVIPQDTWEFAHIDGNTDNEYDPNVINLVDGWGIEDFSATTVSRLANLTKVGIKGTANTNGSTVKIVTENQKIAADNNILWHPRLSAEVYQSPGIGNPGYAPIYSPSSNSYNIINHPIPAGLAYTVNKDNVYSMMDAKNYLYMISYGKYANWPDWEANPTRRLDITTTPGYLVPFAGGRFQPIGNTTVVAQAIEEHGTEWDFFWVAKATHKMKAERRILRNSRPQNGTFFILTPISMGFR